MDEVVDVMMVPFLDDEAEVDSRLLMVFPEVRPQNLVRYVKNKKVEREMQNAVE